MIPNNKFNNVDFPEPVLPTIPILSFLLILKLKLLIITLSLIL